MSIRPAPAPRAGGGPDLDHRYGRTPERTRRGRLAAVAAGVALAGALIAWAAWTGVGGAARALDTETVAVTVQSDRATTVRWLVTGRPDTALVCTIEARDASAIVVGLVEEVVPATGRADRAGDTVVRTVRRADRGLIASCRDA